MRSERVQRICDEFTARLLDAVRELSFVELLRGTKTSPRPRCGSCGRIGHNSRTCKP